MCVCLSGCSRKLYHLKFSVLTCTRCHLSLPTRGGCDDKHLFTGSSSHAALTPHYSVKEEDVINSVMVMCSVRLDVNHTQSFQEGIIILLFAVGLPGWRGLSVFSLPRTELLWWASRLLPPHPPLWFWDQQGSGDYMATRREMCSPLEDIEFQICSPGHKKFHQNA